MNSIAHVQVGQSSFRQVLNVGGDYEIAPRLGHEFDLGQVIASVGDRFHLLELLGHRIAFWALAERIPRRAWVSTIDPLLHSLCNATASSGQGSSTGHQLVGHRSCQTLALAAQLPHASPHSLKRLSHIERLLPRRPLAACSLSLQVGTNRAADA